MTTLNHLLQHLRTDLGDTDLPNAQWSEDDLTRHLLHALRDYSHQLPRQLTTTLTTTPDSRDLDISSLTALVAIQAVEYPTGQYPPAYVRWSLWGTTLTLLTDGAPSDAEHVNVYWLALHTLDPTGTTVPPKDEDLITLGAAGYALQQLAAEQTNAVNTGGTQTPIRLRQQATALLAEFYTELHRRSPKAGIRTAQLYTPAAPMPTQSTDPGP